MFNTEFLPVNIAIPDKKNLTLIVVYRPPDNSDYKIWLDQFQNFLVDYICHTDTSELLLIGDLNIHVNDKTNVLAKNLLNL